MKVTMRAVAIGTLFLLLMSCNHDRVKKSSIRYTCPKLGMFSLHSQAPSDHSFSGWSSVSASTGGMIRDDPTPEGWNTEVHGTFLFHGASVKGPYGTGSDQYNRVECWYRNTFIPPEVPYSVGELIYWKVLPTQACRVDNAMVREGKPYTVVCSAP